ncbi:MAG: TonB family protein [Pseudomonadota bacterium]
MRRTFGSLGLALLVVIALFLLMRWMILPPEGDGIAPAVTEGVDIVQAREQDEPEDEPLQQLQAAAPPPPPTPAALDFDGPKLPVPSASVFSAVGPIRIDTKIGSGSKLGGGAFGGFARGGGGGAGGGFGRGEGFVGKDLIPLSTARPQFPEYAYRRSIEGWVEVVFTVMPSGRVQDVKIIDANPKGVFEATTVESVSNWIYAEHSKARSVKQRVDFKLEDFKYNWR